MRLAPAVSLVAHLSFVCACDEAGAPAERDAGRDDARVPDGAVPDATVPDAALSDAASPDAAIPDESPLVGAFQVQLLPALEGSATAPARAEQATFFGRVQDGPSPELITWRTTMTEGPCQLLEPSVPFCETPCGGSAACVSDDVCAPYPAKLDVGEIAVTGVRTAAGESTWTVRAVAGNYQRSGLAYPPFAPGEDVRIEAPGGEVPAFTLEAQGIAPLELTSPPITLASGVAPTLTWAPGPAGAQSTVTVRLDISHHGGTKGKVECRAADTGALTLPSALLDALVALGTAGYPTVIVAREARAATRVPAGRVALVLASTIEQSVEVPGVVSCVDDTACPSPQVCGDDLQCH